MLFNSTTFCFYFLPVVLIVFYALGQSGRAYGAQLWLSAASLFFYAWWDWPYVFLLLAVTAATYLASVRVTALRRAGRDGAAKGLVTVGIVGLLCLLGYYKYTNFFLDTLSALLGGGHLGALQIILPLGISFFTFQKIAYLADSYAGKVDEHEPVRFLCFVTFFPQLIAGPIVHHAEFIPQLRDPAFGRWRDQDFADGLKTFIVGLFQKVALADSCAVISDKVFAAAAEGKTIDAADAWAGALAYTFQIFFDFSGYSTMAIGLAMMFGLRLPTNFDAPYRALSIIDFWRRWHMTLSRFLRDYVYIPLGGNRQGPARRHVNLMATMLVGGLWHGANWNFVVWGGLHGGALVLNHLWRGGVPEAYRRSIPYKAVAWALTLLAVIVAWVFFRATSFQAAGLVLQGMAAVTQPLPPTWGAIALRPGGNVIELWSNLLLLGLCMTVCLAGRRMETLPPLVRNALVLATAGFVLQALIVGGRSGQFIYFQF